jgi:Tfp pilus assembly protein PilN
MIRVNLLPPEYRKVERTPILRFVTIICGVVLSTSALGVFLYVHFAMLVKVVSEREKREETYLTKKVVADRSVALDHEAREYRRRQQTIEEIAKSRKLWSRKLDQFCDIVHNKGDVKRHLVWLTDMKTLAPAKGAGGGFYIRGFSGGSEISRLSDFHLDLKNSDFFEGFTSIDNPEGSVVRFDDGLAPESAWEFDFNLRMAAEAPKKRGER